MINRNVHSSNDAQKFNEKLFANDFQCFLYEKNSRFYEIGMNIYDFFCDICYKKYNLYWHNFLMHIS